MYKVSLLNEESYCVDSVYVNCYKLLQGTEYGQINAPVALCLMDQSENPNCNRLGVLWCDKLLYAFDIKEDNLLMLNTQSPTEVKPVSIERHMFDKLESVHVFHAQSRVNTGNVRCPLHISIEYAFKLNSCALEVEMAGFIDCDGWYSKDFIKDQAVLSARSYLHVID